MTVNFHNARVKGHERDSEIGRGADMQWIKKTAPLIQVTCLTFKQVYMPLRLAIDAAAAPQSGLLTTLLNKNKEH